MLSPDNAVQITPTLPRGGVWLYYIGLFPIALLLVFGLYELRRRSHHVREQRPAASQTILLVDDDQKICQLTSHQLQRHGFHVLAAGDPQTALGLAKSYPGHIDLVIADVIMPGMSGLEFAECMRGNRPLTPVIFISGLAGAPNVPYGEAAGTTFLEKPFKFEMLKRKVDGVLEATRAS
jgi:CheY-like chemotaxis protein